MKDMTRFKQATAASTTIYQIDQIRDLVHDSLVSKGRKL